LICRNTLTEKKIRDIYVLAGSPYRLVDKLHRAQIVEVARFIIHDQFVFEEGQADIGIVLLKESLVLDGVKAQAIQLPRHETKIGTVATTIGWGRLYSVNKVNFVLDDLLNFLFFSVSGLEWTKSQ